MPSGRAETVAVVVVVTVLLWVALYYWSYDVDHVSILVVGAVLCLVVVALLLSPSLVVPDRPLPPSPLSMGVRL